MPISFLRFYYSVTNLLSNLERTTDVVYKINEFGMFRELQKNIMWGGKRMPCSI